MQFNKKQNLTKYFFLAISVVFVILFFGAKNVSAATNVYYSVSPFGTGDIKTGTPTATISSGVMTLSVSQTGNIGQGVRVTYDTNKIAYISRVNSPMSFNVITAIGEIPSDEISAVTVNSIAHEYASLSAAEAGFTDANHINNTNLVTADVVVNLACYYDHGDYTTDTSVIINFGTTDATRYLKIYTPMGGTQSIINNRHDGAWDINKYYINSINPDIVVIQQSYTKIDGLQIYGSQDIASGEDTILVNSAVTGISIDHCIIRTSHGNGLSIQDTTGTATAVIKNSVLYSNGISPNAEGIDLNNGLSLDVLNCTINGFPIGLRRLIGAMVITNSAVFGNTDDFNGTMTISHSASDDGDGTNPQTLNSSNNYENEFVDITTSNFNLVDGGVCKDNGTNVGAPTDDIIGTSRPQNATTDIGAFEPIVNGYFISQIKDTIGAQEYGTITWTEVLNGGILTVKVRTDSNSDMRGASVWENCNAVINGVDISSNNCVNDGDQYVQYYMHMESDNINPATFLSPTFSDVTIGLISQGSLISSPYDAIDGANLLGGLVWTEDENLPDDTQVAISLRSALALADPIADTTWDIDWQEVAVSTSSSLTSGCTKIGQVVTCDETIIPSTMKDGSGERYFQYKVEIYSSNDTPPTVEQMRVVYVVNANPEIEDFPTAVPNSSGDVDISYQIRDIDSILGHRYVTPSFQYSLNGGTDWTAITAGCLGANDLDDKVVNEPADPPEDTLFTSQNAVWDPSCEAGISTTTYVTNAQVRVTVDDEEAANSDGSSDSINFTLDTTPPAFGANPILVDASQNPAQLTLDATDNSTFFMITASGADQAECDTNLAEETYTDEYAFDPTITLADDPAVICVQFQDEYSNTSATSYATIPETPSAFMIQDTSNLKGDDPEYRLFTAWQVVEDTIPAFGKYEVFRSESEESGYVSLDTNGVISRVQNYYGDSTVIQDTNYYYKVRNEDEDGNISYFSDPIHANANGIQDAGEGGGGESTLPPEISNVTIPTDEIYTNQATIYWDTDEISDSTVEYITSTGGDFTDAPNQGVASMKQDATILGQHIITLTNLTPFTQYYLQLKSTDPDENTGSKKEGTDGYTFTTKDGPAISNVVVSNTTSDSATILWITDDLADSQVFYADNTADLDSESGDTAGSDSETTSHNVELAGLIPETTYYFYVESDIAKDTNAGNYYGFTTLAEEQAEEEDEEGPEISAVVVSDITYNSAKVSWETGEESGSTINYGETISYGKTFGNELESTTIHEVLLNGLNSITTYYFQVTSRDVNENKTIDDNSGSGYTFTTLSPTEDIDEDGEGDQLTDIMTQIQDMLDNYYFTQQEIQDALSGLYSISITSSGPSVDITDTTATFTWTTNRPAIGKIVYWQDTDNEDTAVSQSEVITSAVTDHEVIIKNLNANTKYNYYAYSEGLLGTTTQSENKSFSTGDTAQLNGISINNLTLNSADISWTTTGSISSSTLEYGESIKYGNENNGKTDGNLHTVSLTNLKENTTYHLRVTATDDDGQTLVSDDYSFTTTSLPVISNVEVKDIQIESAVINWLTNVKTDSRVEFKKEGETKGTTSGELEAVTDHSFTLTNLFPGTRYTFKVSSKDTFNNESSSEEQSFTTQEDLNPPKITNVKSDTTVFPGKEAQIQTIISWNTDKDSSSILAYREGVEKDPTLIDKLKNPDTNKIDNWKLIKKQDLTKNHLFVLTDLKPASVYQFRTASYDKHNNVSVSENYSLLTPTKQQSVLDLIVSNFENIFSWVKKVGE